MIFDLITQKVQDDLLLEINTYTFIIKQSDIRSSQLHNFEFYFRLDEQTALNFLNYFAKHTSREVIVKLYKNGDTQFAYILSKRDLFASYKYNDQCLLIKSGKNR